MSAINYSTNSDYLNQVKVLIAIQARTNSSRFPQKIYQLLGKKMVLQHVIDKAVSAKVYLERINQIKQINCSIAVLHPHDDFQLMMAFKKSGVALMGGSEKDVLSRYINAQATNDYDFVVRLTSDCPLILDFVISKHINVAVFNDLDYVNNVDESCRQSADGLDVEVMSRKAIQWLKKNADSDYEKEHVTVAIREQNPIELRQAFISHKFDTSNMKLSLDTEEDLNRIRSYYHEREHKANVAEKKYGRRLIYEI